MVGVKSGPSATGKNCSRQFFCMLRHPWRTDVAVERNAMAEIVPDNFLHVRHPWRPEADFASHDLTPTIPWPRTYLEYVMKNLKIFTLLGLTLIMSLLLTACSDDTDQPTTKAEATGDHVWKTQTDALQTAKDMAKKMQETMKQQQEQMNEDN